jgi:phosphohistidine phosphatase
MSNFTTNQEDLREAEKLQARLRHDNNDDDDDDDDDDVVFQCIPNVTIAEGAHKYVLITGVIPAGSNNNGKNNRERQHFVVSKKNANYHRNAAEPMVAALERSGYKSISILGGGRIALDKDKKTISIYGYSYGFGLADHALSKSIIEMDPDWKEYTITWSNEGY